MKYFFCGLCLTFIVCCKRPNPNTEKIKTLFDSTQNDKTQDTIERHICHCDSGGVELTTSKPIDKIEEEEINKATVSLSDSSFIVGSSKFLDHKIFGYEKPDTTSKKLILISDYTNDVQGNPYKCKFGAYYNTWGMDSIDIKFVARTKYFIKTELIKADKVLTTLYIDKKWVDFVP